MRPEVCQCGPHSRMHEHGADLFGIDRIGAIVHGFDEGAAAEVSHGPQDALRDARDEVEGHRNPNRRLKRQIECCRGAVRL